MGSFSSRLNQGSYNGPETVYRIAQEKATGERKIVEHKGTGLLEKVTDREHQSGKDQEKERIIGQERRKRRIRVVQGV